MADELYYAKVEVVFLAFRTIVNHRHLGMRQKINSSTWIFQKWSYVHFGIDEIHVANISGEHVREHVQ